MRFVAYLSAVIPQSCFVNKYHDRTLFADSRGASSGIDSNLEQTRTIVASLQTAVDFVKVVSESLAVLTQLLASSTMTDVQEAITLLIYCHKFQVKSTLYSCRSDSCHHDCGIG